MKKVISFIIAAAILSAGVYAAEPEVVEVVTASEQIPFTEEPVQPDEPPMNNDIAFEDPIQNDIAFEEPMEDEEYLPEDDGLDVTTADGIGEILPTLGNIDEYFAANGYPDYLSFICNVAASINGFDPASEEEYQPKMTYWWDVGVVNATPAQKAEIQALIDELYPIENNLTFIDCTYSYAEREALVPEILETVKKIFPDIQGVNVSLIRNTEQIGVTLDIAVFDEEPIEIEMVREKLYAIYGDLVFVSEYATVTDDCWDDSLEVGDIPTVGIGAVTAEAEYEIDDTIPQEEEGIAEGSNEDDGAAPAATVGGDYDSAPTAGEIAAIAPPVEQSGDNTIMWICIVAAFVIALGTIAFIYRAKLIPIFATSGGDVTVNKKQAEEAVKNSEVTPDDNILQAIKEKIDK